MSCLSLAFLFNLCVWIVIVIAMYSILKLLLPYLTQFLPSLVVKILEIVIWAVMAIIALYVIFLLLSCLLSGVGFHFPLR
jgi:hypothetical protein